MPDGIQQLTVAMAAGDAEAVGTFCGQYFDWMFIQARLATRRDEAFCLDVVQDAMLRVMRAIQPVDSEPRLRAWLRVVVRTTSLDLLRGERRRTAREAAVARPEVVSPPDCNEQTDLLTQQLTQLDPRLVQLLELRYEQRWTLRRIGQLLGVSTGAIDSRLRRALRGLSEAHDTDEAAVHDDGV
jgi:RNA polymerase sigma-70 factor (ECF subfamily)